MKNVLLYLLLCLTLAACKKDGDATPEGVSIRIKNASQYQFTNIYVNSPGGENHYGSLATGQSSEYKSFTFAYSYAYVKVVANGQEIVWQPRDYVGEQPLQAGSYTYVLDVKDIGRREISFHLERR